MNLKFIASLALVGALLIPAATFAATYEYVNTSGSLETETANSPAQAVSEPTDIAPTSGVILVTDTTTVNQSGNPTYEYVTTNGTLATISAENPTQAILEAGNKAPGSGVILLSN